MSDSNISSIRYASEMLKKATRIALRAAAVLACVALLISLHLDAAQALNQLQDYFVQLSARPLGMGGAAAAVPQAASVFLNPAALAQIHSFRLMHNHSLRHFPGSHAGKGRELDQLDGDTQALVVPLPLATYAHGFTFSGEMGFDYRNMPEPDTSVPSPDLRFTQGLGYPREQLWGHESYDALAFGTGLPVSFGACFRQHLSRFEPESGSGQASWLRLGQGEIIGWLAQPFGSLTLGSSKERTDFDYLLLDENAASRPDSGSSINLHGAPDYSLRLKKSRSGYSLRPFGWLNIAADTGYEDYRFPASQALISGEAQDRTRRTDYCGVEIQLGYLLWIRTGSFEGNPTVGLSVGPIGVDPCLRLNYAEIAGFLPKITEAGTGFEDIHILGFD